MAFAPARVTPFVMQRLQVPVQVLIYAGLFVCAEYLVNWLHLPLPANLVGMLMMLALIVCRVIPLNWVRAGARWLLAEMLLGATAWVVDKVYRYEVSRMKHE